MKTKNLPKTLQEKQKEQRLNTIKKVQDAIDLLKDEGSIVSKKKLIEITGLSSATFSKQHVIDVLKVNKVCQFKNIKQIQKDNNKAIAEQLYLKISKLERDNNSLKSKLQDKEIAISKLKSDYDELQSDYNIILGKIHLILRKVDEREIDIGIDIDNLE